MNEKQPEMTNLPCDDSEELRAMRELITDPYPKSDVDAASAIECARSLDCSELELIAGDDCQVTLLDEQHDEAEAMLNKLRSNPYCKADAVNESMFWQRSKRCSELLLAQHMLSAQDCRRALCTVYLKRLTEQDITDLIALSLAMKPVGFRSTARLTIRTEMPLKQLLRQIDAIPGLRISEQAVYVTLEQPPLMTRLKTTDIESFKALEHVLDNLTCYSIQSRAKFTLRAMPQDVYTTISFDSERKRGDRTKVVVIEQNVDRADDGRSVQIKEELNRTEVYEIGDQEPFWPLHRTQCCFDLIRYLEEVKMMSNC